MSPATRRCLWILAGSALLGAVYETTVTGRISALDRSLRAAHEQILQRSEQRPVLEGQAVEGDAWVHYLAGLEDLGHLSNRELGEALQGGELGERSSLRDQLRAAGPALQAFVRGARCSRGHLPPRALERRVHPRTQAHLRGRWGGRRDPRRHTPLASRALRLEARWRLLEGLEDSAIELLLAVVQFSVDAGRHGILADEFDSHSLQWDVVDELAFFVSSGHLTPGGSARVVAALRRLEGHGRPSSGLENEITLHTRWLLSEPGYPPPPGRVGWSCGFGLVPDPLHGRIREKVRRGLHAVDPRLRVLDFASAGDALLRVRSRDLVRGTRAFEERIEDHGHPLVPRLLYLTASGEMWLLLRARWRVVRGAYELAAHGELPVLGDPLGTSLRSRQEEDRILCWSVGRNRIDDGGQGGIRMGLDYVVEVPRRE